MRQILSNGFEKLGLHLTEAALADFQRYYDYLTERNSVMNLTAISGEENTAKLHFLDCAALLTIHDFSGASVIDIGSGAGFPGIPLKICRPDISLTLLDSQQKRVLFMEEACASLGFSGVRCVKARAEDAALEMGESFDAAVSRAVAKLDMLCELCLPFVRVGGVFIAMKGPDCTSELQAAANAIRLLGGGRPEVRNYTIPNTDITHSAVIIEKVKATPQGYPRSFSKIKNAPL